MYDELVKRLREAENVFTGYVLTCYGGHKIEIFPSDIRQAADAIEELSARLEAHNEWFAKADKKIEEYKDGISRPTAPR